MTGANYFLAMVALVAIAWVYGFLHGAETTRAQRLRSACDVARLDQLKPAYFEFR